MFNRSSLSYSIGLGILVAVSSLLISAVFLGPMVVILAYAVVVILRTIDLQDVPVFKSRFRLALGATFSMGLIHAVALVFARPMWGAPAWIFAWHFAASTILAVLLALVIAALSGSGERPATA
jgi:hypothetical protein